jgi:hypothetical protein
MNIVRITQQAAILASLTSMNILAYSNLVSAQQRVCVTTDEGTTVCGVPKTKPSKESNNNSPIVPILEQEGFSIKLNRGSNLRRDTYPTVSRY